MFYWLNIKINFITYSYDNKVSITYFQLNLSIKVTREFLKYGYAKKEIKK